MRIQLQVTFHPHTKSSNPLDKDKLMVSGWSVLVAWITEVTGLLKIVAKTQDSLFQA